MLIFVHAIKNSAVVEQQKRRKYPVGIQTFSRIISNGYVYVDKTNLVWQMANEDNPFLFLARPRRFGQCISESEVLMCRLASP